MAKLFIGKRKEWFGKKTKFDIIIDNEKRGEINGTQQEISLDLYKNHHHIIVRFDKTEIYNEKIEIKKDLYFSLNSNVKNLRLQKLLFGLSSLNLLVIMTVDVYNNNVLFFNILLLCIVLPDFFILMYYSIFKRNQFFRLVPLDEANGVN